MAEMRTTVEQVGRRPVYIEAAGITQPFPAATASEASHQRMVVTSLTGGVVSLRYAPRTPKASEPVDTAS